MEKGEGSDYASRLEHAPATTTTNTVHRPSRIANPAPAGLFAFASTTFLLSMYNLNARGVSIPNVVVGMAIFAGGLVQLLSGIWEFPRGNVFGATAFTSYGAFWMSYATIFIPGSGVLQAYAAADEELHNALGLYLIVWFMVTVMFIFPVVRRNIAFTVLLSTLAIALLMLALAEFTGSPMVQKAGGSFGLITGAVAYYIGVSEMMSVEETAFMRLPLGAR